ncbi:beta-ketoacyl-[acyl-carrier-protein] synthase family protein [Streptomyces sp. NRRL F-5123]|uniref:beta-ketoacyl-[acyl-carrier-protein] synthase family protein n=1 Tax=Streptomyces sp. NRRL F-5123 TaxID=1463856 RepID=UPI0004E1066E|nr:beta-ketoacyl-[acyl-carrier-protein] synthase family protein [Streptomyces sp. NRRL F-5123]
MEKRIRVVVTGLGATTPVGGDSTAFWQSLLGGSSGVRALTAPWAAELPVRIAAPAARDPAGVLDRVEARRLDRSAQFALVAAREAWADAGLGRPGSCTEPRRTATVVSSAVGGWHTLLGSWDAMTAGGARAVPPLTIPKLMPNAASARISMEFGAYGGAHAAVSACASGAEAIAWACDLIRCGRADVVLAGGCEAVIHPLAIAAFAAMRAMSRRNADPEAASRPFDADRDGFVLGEGAGVLVLESAAHAARRGARVYAEVAGHGASADAHHLAQPDPAGRGVAEALAAALADADASPYDIAHVAAHATATPAGDLAEARALAGVLGPAAVRHAGVTATKSMTGHMLGASGAVQTIAAVLALHERVAPPVLNLSSVDPEIRSLGIDLIRDKPRELPFDGPLTALSNSFGFGGHNVVLVLRTP